MALSQRQAQEKQRHWAERERRLEQKNALEILNVLRKRLAPKSKDETDYTLDIDAKFVDKVLSMKYAGTDGTKISLAEIIARHLPAHHNKLMEEEENRKRLAREKRNAKKSVSEKGTS